MNRILNVTMLGSFSIELDGKTIDDSTSRTRKVWLLLAYLLYHRGRTISQKELISLLWDEEEEKDNPQNALRTNFHRLRTMLNRLDDTMGHDLIVHQNGGYNVSDAFDVKIDVLEFQRLCQAGGAAESEAEQLACWLEALELYREDFLVKLSGESWSRSVSLQLHELYLQTVKDALSLLEKKAEYPKASELCFRALKIEPYSEDLYLHQMISLMKMGQRKEAAELYEKMSRIFLEDFGVLPSQEIRNVYYEAIRCSNETAVPMEVVQEQLKEPEVLRGALVCEYDFFKVLYYSTARLIERTGAAVHICMMNVEGEGGEPLSRRSLTTAMDNLQEQLRLNLRRGDVVSRCSRSQFLIMLHLANYENSCMVCERIMKAFYRKYPHTPAKLTYTVAAVKPEQET